MSKVEILNNTTLCPIELIGECAGICYGADTSSSYKNYKRGLNCIKSGHWRTLEFPDVYLYLSGYSAKVIRELYTHIGGSPTRLQESTRYIDYSDFKYVIPPSISKNKDALDTYENMMEEIRKSLINLQEMGIPKEDSSMLLPFGMETGVCIKYNARTLATMSENRLCTRAFWEYRNKLMPDIINGLRWYSSEWEELCELIFKPKCEKLGYCPELNGCGRYPQKNEK